MCPPPHDASFLTKIRHDFHNSYYKLSTLYILVMITVIFLVLVFGWHFNG